MSSYEQQSRDMLERMSSATNWHDPQRLTGADVIELANLLAEVERLKKSQQEWKDRFFRNCRDIDGMTI